MNGKKIIKYFTALLFVFFIAFSVSYITRDFYFEYFFISPKYMKDFISQSKNIDIIVVGDMMLDRNVRNIIDRDGFNAYFEGIRNIIEIADFAIANLEGPFTTKESVTSHSTENILQFTFDPKLVPKLKKLGFDIFGLSNNHTM